MTVLRAGYEMTAAYLADIQVRVRRYTPTWGDGFIGLWEMLEWEALER